MNEKVVNKIKEAADHDSQIIAPYYPTAMHFVPSINGVSHRPAENTDLDDLVVGVQVLARTLFELAYEN